MFLPHLIQKLVIIPHTKYLNEYIQLISVNYKIDDYSTEFDETIITKVTTIIVFIMNERCLCFYSYKHFLQYVTKLQEHHNEILLKNYNYNWLASVLFNNNCPDMVVGDELSLKNVLQLMTHYINAGNATIFIDVRDLQNINNDIFNKSYFYCNCNIIFLYENKDNNKWETIEKIVANVIPSQFYETFFKCKLKLCSYDGKFLEKELIGVKGFNVFNSQELFLIPKTCHNHVVHRYVKFSSPNDLAIYLSHPTCFSLKDFDEILHGLSRKNETWIGQVISLLTYTVNLNVNLKKQRPRQTPDDYYDVCEYVMCQLLTNPQLFDDDDEAVIIKRCRNIFNETLPTPSTINKEYFNSQFITYRFKKSTANNSHLFPHQDDVIDVNFFQYPIIISPKNSKYSRITLSRDLFIIEDNDKNYYQLVLPWFSQHEEKIMMRQLKRGGVFSSSSLTKAKITLNYMDCVLKFKHYLSCVEKRKKLRDNLLVKLAIDSIFRYCYHNSIPNSIKCQENVFATPMCLLMASFDI